MPDLGTRNNSGKLRYDLVCPITTEAIARVSQFGAAEYGERNWEKGMPYSTSFTSLMRHLMAWWQGESHDPHSNLPHSWHVLWNAQAIAEMERRLGEGDPRLSILDIDDRPYAMPGVSAKNAKENTKNLRKYYRDELDSSISHKYNEILPVPYDVEDNNIKYPNTDYSFWLGSYETL